MAIYLGMFTWRDTQVADKPLNDVAAEYIIIKIKGIRSNCLKLDSLTHYSSPVELMLCDRRSEYRPIFFSFVANKWQVTAL